MGFGGFSWKRALGVTKAKSRISRAIGIPLTKSGRQRKFGAALGGSLFGAIPSGAARTAGQVTRSRRVTQSDSLPQFKPPPGAALYQPSAGMSCLLTLALLALAAAAFPVGIIAAFGVLLYFSLRANKKKIASLNALADKVKCFIDRMESAALPEIAALTRGSPDKIEMFERLRLNHLRVAAALATGRDDQRAIQFCQRLAACATMKELEDKDGGRLAMLVEMVLHADCPEALYCIHGVVERMPNAAKLMTEVQKRFYPTIRS